MWRIPEESCVGWSKERGMLESHQRVNNKSIFVLFLLAATCSSLQSKSMNLIGDLMG